MLGSFTQDLICPLMLHERFTVLPYLAFFFCLIKPLKASGEEQ